MNTTTIGASPVIRGKAGRIPQPACRTCEGKLWIPVGGMSKVTKCEHQPCPVCQPDAYGRFWAPTTTDDMRRVWFKGP